MLKRSKNASEKPLEEKPAEAAVTMLDSISAPEHEIPSIESLVQDAITNTPAANTEDTENPKQIFPQIAQSKPRKPYLSRRDRAFEQSITQQA